MNFSIQPILENEDFTLIPLQESDFERLFVKRVCYQQKIGTNRAKNNATRPTI